VARHQLREALIARYFPEHREELARLVVGNRASQEPNNLEEQLPPVAPLRFDYFAALSSTRITALRERLKNFG
jgi:hypothetical protein